MRAEAPARRLQASGTPPATVFSASEGEDHAPGLSVAERPLRLAMFAPLPPVASGIAAYLLDLLPLLPEPWQIDLFGDTGVTADGDRLGATRPAGLQWFAHTDFAARQAAGPYDLCVYQVGNSAERAWMLPYVAAHPGLLVLHDGNLHAARVEDATRRFDMAGYRRIAEVCNPAAGAALGNLVAGGLGGPALYTTFPLCEDLVRASRLTAMHGELLCGWLRALVPEARVVPLTHWRSVGNREGAAQVAQGRSRAGLVAKWRGLAAPGEVLIGSFGNIGGERRIGRLMAALAGLETAAPWRLVVAGAVDPRLRLREQAAALGIADRISWNAGLADADFLAVMGAVDLAVNLRFPPARASSGVLHQLLQLGVPSIITDVLHWRDYPEAAVARVPPGPDDAELAALRATLSLWIDDPAARAATARAAATWAAEHLAAARMRSSYVAAVQIALDDD